MEMVAPIRQLIDQNETSPLLLDSGYRRAYEYTLNTAKIEAGAVKKNN